MREAHIRDIVPDYSRILVDKRTAEKYSIYFKNKYNRFLVYNWKKTQRYPVVLVKRELLNKKEIILGLQRSAKITRLPDKFQINEDLGWLIGFWHAEGQKGKKKKYKISISNSDLKLVKIFLRIFQSQIGPKEGITIYVRNGNKNKKYGLLFSEFKNIKILFEENEKFKYKKHHFRVDIVNKILYDILNNLFEVAKNQNIFQKGYVAGFIDGDGYVSKEGYLDIRQEICPQSEIIHEYLKKILVSENFEIKDYSKKQFRLMIIKKRYSKKILETFPINHSLKRKRLVPSWCQKGVPTALAKQGPVGRSDKEGPTV